MRTEYALQEITPDKRFKDGYFNGWIEKLHDDGEPLTDEGIARAILQGRNVGYEHVNRTWRLMSRTVSDWEEVK